MNNSEPDWDKTLEGRLNDLHSEFCRDHLGPSLHLKAEVLEYPMSMLDDNWQLLNWT